MTTEPTSTQSNIQQIPQWLWRILQSRGVDSLEQLDYKLSKLIHPHNLKGLDQAKALIINALDKDLPISIVGDYDVDGVTGTVLAVKALRAFGSNNTDYLIPDRFTDGYGFNANLVEQLHKRGCQLAITVDNGITSHQAIDRANELGIKTIITDHHLPKDTSLPQAHVIINPHQPGCGFTGKNLAGVGVVFYLLCAVKTELHKNHWFIFRKIKPPNMADFLDLVALGTLADMATLDYNNRTLIEYGLKRIRLDKASPGIRCLLRRSGVKAGTCTSRDITFSIAPPLNAAGRIGSMETAIQCLLARNWVQANQLAEQLIDINNQRKQLQATMTEQARTLIEDRYSDKQLPELLLLQQPGWHQGLTGLVAGNIKDSYGKSCIVLTQVSQQYSKGSGRAKSNLHLLKLLEWIDSIYPNIFIKFGGHAAATGMTIRSDQFEQLREAVEQHIEEFTGEQHPVTEQTDGSLSTHLLTLETARLLEHLSPWGMGFSEPLFEDEFTLGQQSIIAKRHLRMTLTRGNTTFPAIMFNIDTNIWPNRKIHKVRVHYHLHVNRFLGTEELQLTVTSLLPAEQTA